MNFFIKKKIKKKLAKKKRQNYTFEFSLKTKIITKNLKINNLLKLNTKLNLLKNYLTNLTFKTNLILLKKNYYNLINTNNFFEKLALTLSFLKTKKKKQKDLQKYN